MPEYRPLVRISGRTKELPADGTLPGIGGGSALKGTLVVTFPAGIKNYGVSEWTETVAAVGVAPAHTIFLAVAAHNDDDENHESMLSFVMMAATAGTDEITVTLSSTDLMVGPVKFNWMAV